MFKDDWRKREKLKSALGLVLLLIILTAWAYLIVF